MSLRAEELEQHCQQILNDRRIKNKIVVLCEGEIKDVEGRRSPQAYKRMEQMPDANFYKKCVPKSWKNKLLPQFFNCGDRKDVVDTYCKLRQLNDTQESYLNIEKLFALVDLDIQLHKINNYDYSDTEQIFNALYKKTQIVEQAASQHFIWVTGLIHKEAYFITPEIQSVFNASLLDPQYENSSILLKNLYLKICHEITNDVDLKNNYTQIVNRIDYCEKLDCCDIDKFQFSWRDEFNQAIQAKDNQRIRELVFLLLTIRKAKKYWNQIDPPNDWTSETERFREQLSIEIGEFYSTQDWSNTDNHIPFFFKTLYEFA
jgi:hypothetical protein